MKRILTIAISSLFYLYSYSQETLQSVTDKGRFTTNNLWVGQGSQPGGVTEEALNLGGRIKFLGSISSFMTGPSKQPAIYRSGVSGLAYPFESYDHLILQAGTNGRDIVFVTGASTGAPSISTVIKNNGNVGIGTSDPSTRLHVSGLTRTDGIDIHEGTSFIGFLGRGNYFTGGWSAYPSIMTVTYHARDFAIGGWRKSDGTWMGASIYINSDNGFTGIGTTDPKERLSVNGKIRAQEIKVENTNWPDYVFEPSYKSYSLPELEAYIKENKHLPEIPSAKEVEKEGVSIGEMNAKLLQKIEELTLHLIEQNKQLEMHSRKLEEQGQIIRYQQKEIQSLKRN